MEQSLREKMEAAVAKELGESYRYCKQPDGTSNMEIYADYRDEMDGKTAGEICSGKDPVCALWDKLTDWYFDSECYYRAELRKEIQKELEKEGGPYQGGMSSEEEDVFGEVLDELVYWTYPEDHFMKQEFFVNIMVDTGDGNYDYTLNGIYPCWYGQYEARIDEKSSLLWLARQQGYTKTQLWKALREGDMADPKGFLESCRVELANLPSHMSTLTFLVRMTLEDLITLNRCIKLQDRNGHFYDARKNPYCGYIVIDKDTVAGLFDPWSGGGSVLEIQLEKDVRLPIRYIRSALPDGCDGYSIDSVYGLCGSAWESDAVKEIHVPRNICQMEEAMAG